MIKRNVVIREGVVYCENLLVSKLVCKGLKEYVFTNGTVRCYHCGKVKSGNTKETVIRN